LRVSGEKKFPKASRERNCAVNAMALCARNRVCDVKVYLQKVDQGGAKTESPDSNQKRVLTSQGIRPRRTGGGRAKNREVSLPDNRAASVGRGHTTSSQVSTK